MDEPVEFACTLESRGYTIHGTCAIDFTACDAVHGCPSAWFEAAVDLNVLHQFEVDPNLPDVHIAELLHPHSDGQRAAVRIERIGGRSAQLQFIHPGQVERILNALADQDET